MIKFRKKKKEKKIDSNERVILSLINQEFETKVPASTTMYMTLIGFHKGQKSKGAILNNIIINNSSFRVDKHKEETSLQLYAKVTPRVIEDIKKYGTVSVHLMVSDDPLPLSAMSSINLGCFRLLAILKDSKVTNYNPLTFTGKWEEGYRQHLLLPQR